MLEAETTEHPSTKERVPMSFMVNPEEVEGGVVVGISGHGVVVQQGFLWRVVWEGI